MNNSTMKPTKKEICVYVTDTLELFSSTKNLACSDGELKLQKDLKLERQTLRFLAMSLRGYIKHHVPSTTIKAAEISKKDFTFKNLKDLVTERILFNNGAKN